MSCVSYTRSTTDFVQLQWPALRALKTEGTNTEVDRAKEECKVLVASAWFVLNATGLAEAGEIVDIGRQLWGPEIFYSLMQNPQYRETRSRYAEEDGLYGNTAIGGGNPGGLATSGSAATDACQFMARAYVRMLALGNHEFLTVLTRACPGIFGANGWWQYVFRAQALFRQRLDS